MVPDTLYRLVELIRWFYKDEDLEDVDEDLLDMALQRAKGDIVDALNLILTGYCGK